jgi:hypothetical protein
MGRTVLIFGLIAGAILAGMMVITMPFHEEIGFDRSMVIGYATMVAAFLLVFVGIKSYRDTVAGGTIGFGRAFSVGMLIVLVASACYVATWEAVFFPRIGEEYMAKYQEHSMEKARAKGETPAQLEQRAADMKKDFEMYRNPAIRAAITLLEPLPPGLIIALVSAGILRRRKPTEPVMEQALA